MLLYPQKKICEEEIVMSAAEEIQKIENDIRSHSARLEETTALKPVTSHGVFFYFLPFFIGSFLV